MKILYLSLLLLFSSTSLISQTVTVSGQCITGSIVLNPIANIGGKAAYLGTGTVASTSGVQVSISWLASDNLWVLSFDGQPYFQNACNTALPWVTGNATCPWTAVSGQTCTGGTALSITGAGALPVTLTMLNARVEKEQVIVNWKTASENNNRGFDIQRSADGINWTNIGFVAGSNNSTTEKSYVFTDARPLSGTSFYRLRQVDYDGKMQFSPVVSIKILKQGFYSISGNAGSNIYQLNVEAANQQVELTLTDAGGKRLLRKMAGNGVVIVDISQYPAGIYMLQVTKGRETFTEKLVKF